MKRHLIIIFILTSKFIFGQKVTENWFTYAGCCTERDVLKRENKIRDTIHEAFTTSKTGDTLVITYSEQKNSPYLKRKLTFNDEYNVCDFDQFVLSCDNCTPAFVKEILEAKVYGWVKISENLYYSKTKWTLELTLNADKNNICNIITYRPTKLKKKEFKAKLKT
jgi:hypothetical protein